MNRNVVISLSLFQSKGGILSKACEYIKELRQSNLKLGEDINTLDRLRIDNQLLRQEVCLIVCDNVGTKAIRQKFMIYELKIMSSCINFSGTERKENECKVFSSHYFLVCITLPWDQTKCWTECQKPRWWKKYNCLQTSSAKLMFLIQKRTTACPWLVNKWVSLTTPLFYPFMMLSP